MNNLITPRVNNTISATMINQQPINQMEIIMQNYTFRVSSLEDKVNSIEKDVNTIKSNYLTKGEFFKVGGIALISLIITAGSALWVVFTNLDSKIGSWADKNEQRFQQIESKMHVLDVRLTKVEIKIDELDKKLGVIDNKFDNLTDKIDTLIQQKQVKN
ncbi:hypothetical protein [Glaesserella parasuis]|uniref:hypothetical protein n=1 Tax=Glaesserella parasuis TaxID=738 RepID=UPI0013112EFF|nr:hypothetical protein [Glaesserella parasuis]MDG6281258.1 hypothetical protein [Glaesserella parasuis]MDO9849716.1 hypothetical protein [Glaesserella parasuis]MDP0072144.1 hypothetical protein [Glaesserella parasuis]MDP0097350.1 hypothetical protein [Glaesserella parasuis]MDP0123031.1 hypothetical protein [Glaesserella parasuis]